MNHGWSYCPHCGQNIAFAAERCPQCGCETPRANRSASTSTKSYGVAVTLCGVFGIVGVHHFYIGNIAHGLFDLGLFVATIVLFITGVMPGNEALIGLALLCLAVDAVHTIIVFIRLIIGRQRDGEGRIIAVP